MIIYLAGGVSGNLNKEMKLLERNISMKLYLAGDAYREDILMQLYLAGGNGRNHIINDLLKQNKDMKINILESFYYVDDTITGLIPYLDNFLLDSGAFTFMSNKKDNKIDWQEYIDRYIKYIKENNIKHFFELDIDSIIGYDLVKKYRSYLENGVGKKCIPVWHKSRGLEEWNKLTIEYDYVAIGGIVSKEIKSNEYKYFNYLLEIARKNNCKVHGLGFTNLEGLKKYKFYSVDSTAWTTGNRFGHLYRFENNTIKKYGKKKGQRVKTKEVAFNNFIEWVKFSNYAEKNL